MQFSGTFVVLPVREPISFSSGGHGMTGVRACSLCINEWSLLQQTTKNTVLSQPKACVYIYN